MVHWKMLGVGRKKGSKSLLKWAHIPTHWASSTMVSSHQPFSHFAIFQLCPFKIFKCGRFTITQIHLQRMIDEQPVIAFI